MSSGAYVPRRPQETVLFGLVQGHLQDFFRHAREAYDGPLPKYVKDEFRKYLECGNFSRGFVSRAPAAVASSSA